MSGSSFEADEILLLSHRSHNTRILIPRQHRIIPILRRRPLHIRPSRHKVLMRKHLCQLASNCPIYPLHDLKISGEKYVKVALLNLQNVSLTRSCRGTPN